MLKKLNKLVHDLILIEVTINNFTGGVIKMKGILFVEIIEGSKSTMATLLIIES